jgi:glycosyltransferase involved in cell wall biosynthesis
LAAPFLAVVVPAYNEEDRIAASLESLVDYLSTKPYTWEIVVADDGSSDATASIATESAERLSSVRVISLPHRGKGAAVRSGMLATDAEWRFLCDADLSMEPEQLELFLPGGSPPFEEIVIGSREVPGARRIGEPANRHVKGRAFTMAVWLLAFRGIEDTQCGFKLFRGDVADQIFRRQRLDGFGFDVEVLFMARKMGLTIREQAIDWYYRDGSSMTLIKGLGGFLDIARVRLNWAIGRYRGLHLSPT